MPLVSLSSPRGNTPATLPAPAQSGVAGCDPVSFDSSIAAAPPAVMMAVPVARPEDSIDEGNIPGFLFVVRRTDLALSTPEERSMIMARFNTIKTRADASEYTEEVRVKVRAARTKLSRQKYRLRN